MPVEIQAHSVPFFIDSVNGKVEPWWLDCTSNFSIYTILLKLVVKLKKISLVEIGF